MLLASCELLPTTTVVVLALPPTPEPWESAWGEATFRLSWRSAGSRGGIDAPVAPGQAVRVEIPRTAPVVFRADPVWSRAAGQPSPALAPGERLAWAGAVWPAGLEGRRRLRLRFESGSAAAVLWRLMDAGVDLRSFSVERLLAEIAERLPGDPWSLDVERVTAAIAAGSMRASYVRPPPRYAVDLAVPPGRWLACSPFRPAVSGGGVWGELPRGITPFYSADGRRVIVEVDAAGRAWSSARP